MCSKSRTMSRCYPDGNVIFHSISADFRNCDRPRGRMAPSKVSPVCLSSPFFNHPPFIQASAAALPSLLGHFEETRPCLGSCCRHGRAMLKKAKSVGSSLDLKLRRRISLPVIFSLKSFITFWGVNYHIYTPFGSDWLCQKYC